MDHNSVKMEDSHEEAMVGPNPHHVFARALLEALGLPTNVRAFTIRFEIDKVITAVCEIIPSGAELEVDRIGKAIPVLGVYTLQQVNDIVDVTTFEHNSMSYARRPGQRQQEDREDVERKARGQHARYCMRLDPNEERDTCTCGLAAPTGMPLPEAEDARRTRFGSTAGTKS